MPEYSSRVLFLDQSGMLGGAELSLLDIASSRRRDSAQDLVILFEPGPFVKRLEESKIETSVIPLKISVGKQAGMWDIISSTGRVLAVARQVAVVADSFSVLYANTQKAAVVAAIARCFTRKPVVWHLRDTLDAVHFSKCNRWIAIKAANWFCTRVIANSNATARAFKKAGGKAPVTVVYNGISLDTFNSSHYGGISSCGSELGVPEAVPLLGIFGRLTEWKGHHVLLEALADPRLEQTHLLIVGDALFTEEDKRYSDRLRLLADKEPLKGRIHWLGHRDDIPTLMSTCDLVVHASVQPEPFGRVIVEAMLAGRPVIASAAGGATEIIEDGVTGVLTAPGDARTLATAICRLLQDPVLAKRIAEAGKVAASRRFALEDRVNEIDTVIEELTMRYDSRAAGP